MAKCVLSLLLCLLVFWGCDRKPKDPPPPPVKTTSEVRTALQHFIETGYAGSEAVELWSYFDELKATDPVKADRLRKDAEILSRLTDPGQVRAKAKEILGKL